MSHQTEFKNHTPFAAEQIVLADQDGQEVLVVVVGASFKAERSGGPLNVSEEQHSLSLVDEYFDDPTSSSVRYESCVVTDKLLVDVLINGHAYAPEGILTSNVSVAFQIGDLRKSLLVTGDRRWSSGLRGASYSTPEKFLIMPIIYERTFGGTDPKNQETEMRNPIGLGYNGAFSHNPEIRSQLPNIEYLNDRMNSQQDKPAPAGFGVISRNCRPRIGYAGTYDDTWLEERWPLAPLDFDIRFNQTAPIDQQSRTIRGGEEARLWNLTRDGSWNFNLPRLDIPVFLCYEGNVKRAKLRLDTILIEPDSLEVTMTSRLSLGLPRNKHRLREVVLGHMSQGWIRAKTSGKRYLDNLQSDGLDSKKRSFYS